MKNKPFNEDTGIEESEPINTFLFLAACIIIIIVGISLWVTAGALVALLFGIFVTVWGKIVLNFKK